MKIERVFNITIGGFTIKCTPPVCPSIGNVIRHSDGRAWLIEAIDCAHLWYGGKPINFFVSPATERQCLPIAGDDVEMVGPMELVRRLDEAEHNIRALRAECARLGVEACDAKWSLTP